jgi:thiamine pyrophosphate-dependent acetolactate synthase large subunit-like protein
MRSGARMTGEALVRSLAANGVRQVFGIPGVQLDHAADALYHARDDIAFICARNEQAVSYMADGARLGQAARGDVRSGRDG